MLLVLTVTAACDERGQSPTYVRCSPKWFTVVEQCEEPCADPSLLGTDTSCWMGDSAETARTCQPGRYAAIDGHRGCCVFINARVEFEQCNPGLPPDAPDFEDAGISFPD